MKNKWLTSLAVGSLLGFAASVQAIPITGTINMSGDVTLNTSSLATASSASLFANVNVTSGATFAYTGTGGSAVTFNAFGWNPATTPVNPLWTFISGARTYSFNLTTISTVTQNANFLMLTGSGVANITGGGPSYDPTPANWTFTITDSSGGGSTFQFGFADSNTAVPGVPDGGTTVMLLGAAISGLGLLRRKLVS